MLIGQLIRRSHLDQVGNLWRNVGGFHFAGFIAAYTHYRERTASGLGAFHAKAKLVADGFAGFGGHEQVNLNLILKAQRLFEITIHVHSWPAHAKLWGDNRSADRAKKGVFSVFHVTAEV